MSRFDNHSLSGAYGRDFEEIQTEFASEEGQFWSLTEKLCQPRGVNGAWETVGTGGLCSRQAQSQKLPQISDYVARRVHGKGMETLASPGVALKGIHGGIHRPIEPSVTNWSCRLEIEESLSLANFSPSRKALPCLRAFQDQRKGHTWLQRSPSLSLAISQAVSAEQGRAPVPQVLEFSGSLTPLSSLL